MLTAKLRREAKIFKSIDIRKGKKVKTWRIVIYPVVVDDYGKIIKVCGRKRSGPFLKEIDARRNLNNFVNEKLQEIEDALKPATPASKSPGADKLLDDFLYWGQHTKAKKWRESTYLTYEDAVETQIRPYLRNRKISDLQKKTEKFQDYLEKCTYERKGKTVELSDARKRLVYNVYRCFLEFLLITKIISVDLRPYLGKVRFQKGKPREVILEEEEIAHFIQLAKEKIADPNIWLMIEFDLAIGARKGEVFGLLVSDVNFKARTVSISKTYDSRTKSKYGKPKSSAGVRTVEMPEAVIEPLEKMLNYRRKFFTEAELLDQPLFIKNGKPYASSTFTNAFKIVQDAFEDETGKHVVIHDLRRTFASIACENSEGNHDYMKRKMGHSSYSTTAEIYAICNAKQARKYQKRFNETMNGALENINNTQAGMQEQ